MVEPERVDDLRKLRKNQPGKTIISGDMSKIHRGGLYETDKNIYVGLGVPAVH